MAAAIPAAIGVGGSIIGGIQGKGAAKRQEREAQKFREMLAPLVNQQMQGLQFAQQQGQQLFPQATNAINTVFNTATGTFEPLMKDYQSMLREASSSQGKFDAEGEGFMNTGRNLMNASQAGFMGALSGLGDLEQSLRPFINEGASAIEKFLPKGSALNRLLAGQIGDINQSFKTASQNIEAFAPRGGGRISSLANNDIKRQQDLNRARSEGTMGFGQMALNNFFQGVEGSRNIQGQKAGIAGQQGQLGLGAIGAGQQSKQQGIADFSAKSNVGLQQLQSALQALGLAGGAAGNLSQLAGSTLNLGTQGGGNIYDMVNQQQNRAYGAQPQQGNAGKGLGGFLVDMFNTPGAKDWMGGIFGGGKKAAGAPAGIPSQKF